MASGINNTFRQVGIATGIAALGAIFQSQIASYLTSTTGLPHAATNKFAQEIASGGGVPPPTGGGNPRGPSPERAQMIEHSAFIHGLNTILLVAAFVLFIGAILAFVLVRQQDFVASVPQAVVESG